MAVSTRFRFGAFVVSRRQRLVQRDGRTLPLIPRYFDLLVLLIEQRHTAVSRREIFDRVWGDVIVSDGSLSQAIRTLRRTLGDDSREPLFIRTVSRHGYSFVFPEVVEEPDDVAVPVPPAPPAEPLPPREPIDALVDRLLRDAPDGEMDDEDRREAAEQLHQIGTAAALERLRSRIGHARALALLRDTRWDVEGAGDVPLVGQPEGLEAAKALIALRVRRARRMAARRSAAATTSAAVVGAASGAIAGVLLSLMPGSLTPVTASVVLAGFGAIVGGSGGFGVAAGIAAAEVLARSRRRLAIVVAGAAGGQVGGTLGHLALRWTLEALFGLHLAVVSGPLEGWVLGGAAGVGYALVTDPHTGGMATPTGRRRTQAVLAVAVCTGIAGALLAVAGRPLAGGMINAIALASSGSKLVLAPLGYVVGEPSFGPTTRAIIAGLEGACFGMGLCWGLTRRPSR